VRDFTHRSLAIIAGGRRSPISDRLPWRCRPCSKAFSLVNNGPKNAPPERFLAAQRLAPTTAKITSAFPTSLIAL